MSYNLDPSNIQIGGFPYDINPEYWSNPGRVLRSPRETLDRIEKLSAELSKLRIDAMKQILELFREHPTRVYAFEYEGSEWEGSTIKVYNEVAYSFVPLLALHIEGMNTVNTFTTFSSMTMESLKLDSIRTIMGTLN